MKKSERNSSKEEVLRRSPREKAPKKSDKSTIKKSLRKGPKENFFKKKLKKNVASRGTA